MKAKMSFTRFGRLLVTAVTFALFLLGSATSARAAALSVVTSNPAAGATLPASPPAIRITFNQKIISAVTMTVTCNGVVVPVPPANASADQLDIVLDLSGTTPLPQGNCVAEWGAQPLAGGAVDKGSLSFSVAASAAPGGAASTQTTIAPAVVTPSGSGSKLVIDPPAVDGPLFLARLLSGVGLAALFGALVIIVTAWPEGVEYVLTIRFIRSAWILAMAATVGFVVCLTAKSTGVSIGNALNPKSWSDLTDTVPGKAALARLVLTTAAGWVAIRPERCIDQTTQLPALAIPGLAVATMGLSRAGGSLELVGYAAGIIHALAIAVWFGGLVLLARVVLSGPGQEDLVHATRGFSRFATPALVATVVTGAIQMYRLDRDAPFTSSHGQVLLLKVVLVVAVVFVGVATRQFIVARLTRVDVLAAAVAARLRRAVGMEAVGGVLILLLTSWMLALQPANLGGAGLGPSGYALSEHFVDAKGTNDVTVYVTPSRVGTNAVYIKLLKPATGVTNFTVTFTPPLGALANSVVLSPGLIAAGSNSLDQAEGIPFDVAGSWTMNISITTPLGEFHDPIGKTFIVSSADGAAPPVLTIAPITAPPVTPAPILPPAQVPVTPPPTT